MNDAFAQFLIFLMFVYVGMVIALLYPVTHISKKYKILGDIIFAVVAVAAVFFSNLIWNDGQFRFFIFLGVGLGIFFCSITITPMLDTALGKLYNFAKENFGRVNADETDVHISKQKSVVRGNSMYRDISRDAKLAGYFVRAKERIFGKGGRTRKRDKTK
ncbi:MAG TPA: spore cortex biosynthesis protein YabQ [Clostridia bacterium]|nr:spore cortex biosynthesis protein YabQ [Clostridia bacterium]